MEKNQPPLITIPPSPGRHAQQVDAWLSVLLDAAIRTAVASISAAFHNHEIPTEQHHRIIIMIFGRALKIELWHHRKCVLAAAASCTRTAELQLL